MDDDYFILAMKHPGEQYFTEIDARFPSLEAARMVRTTVLSENAGSEVYIGRQTIVEWADSSGWTSISRLIDAPRRTA